MTVVYNLKDFDKISEADDYKPYILTAEFHALVGSIDNKIIPFICEKTPDRFVVENKFRPQQQQQHQMRNDNWDHVQNKKVVFKSVQTTSEGVDKCILDIRVCINKLSNKNYESQKSAIFDHLQNCLEDENDEKRGENFKKISGFIFSVASTNAFFAEIYATLYTELMDKYSFFQELLHEYLKSYVSGVQTIKYVDPNANYEDFCVYNKENDVRKANALFITKLVSKKALGLDKLTSIIVAFQLLTIQYKDEPNRVHEIEEIAEILFLIVKEGNGLFQDCKQEDIWNTYIIPNIHLIASVKRGENKSISSRAIFKYMDIKALIMV